MTKEAKDMVAKRKIAWIYLLYRMFEGNYLKLIRTMCISGMTVADLQDWEKDYKDAVYEVIQEEDTKGVILPDQTPVPSIKAIKEKVLRRCDDLIAATTDPAKLAVVYKTLSEFEVADDKNEMSVLDAINATIKPKTEKKKGTVSMLDKMKSQKNKFVAESLPDDEETEED